MIIKLLLFTFLAHAGFGDKIYNDNLAKCPSTKKEFKISLDKIEQKLKDESKKFTTVDWNKLLLSKTLDGQFVTFFIANLAPSDNDFFSVANTCFPPFKEFKKKMTEKSFIYWKSCIENQFRDPLQVPDQIKTCFEKLK